MKRLLVLLLVSFTIMTTPSLAFTQGMMDSTRSLQVGTRSAISSDGHTAREEQEGKEIWEKLQTKKLECKNLTDGNYGALGEYFMGQMAGNSHEAMNTMMERMMGKDGEEQMHVTLGKRLSGCEPDAQIPQSSVGFIPMMWIMGSPPAGGSPQAGGGGNSMMGYGNFGGMMGGFGLLAIIFWIVLLIDLILFGVWLWKQIQKK